MGMGAVQYSPTQGLYSCSQFKIIQMLIILLTFLGVQGISSTLLTRYCFFLDVKVVIR